MSLTIYGHMVSQPTRAVVWLLNIKNQPYTFVRVDPFRGEAEKPEYIRRAPTGLIPCLENNNQSSTTTIFESAAILVYLCEKYKWTDYYPEDAAVRGYINQYLHWHHTNTRLISAEFFRPLVLVMIGKKKADSSSSASISKSLTLALEVLDGYFLAPGRDYIAGTAKPTIADLQAYCEFDQLEAVKSSLVETIFGKYKNITAWIQRMKGLPKHNEVRVELAKFGKILTSKL
eukprot:PhF_6_TR23772/c0_g1_i1/m.33243/K00799/GST, gst; glutathione S-transferase